MNSRQPLLRNKHLPRLNALDKIHAQQGFTLVEFMIAAALGLMVLLALGGGYLASQKVNEVASSRVSRQQELRLAGNLLVRDARIAGTFGCANTFALTAATSLSKDHSGTTMAVGQHASYFNINTSVGDDRVYGTRIVAASSAVMTNIIAATAFSAASGSDVVIFNYGTNTQPLLTSTLSGANALSGFTVPSSASFTTSTNANARVVLSSCTRLDIFSRNQYTLNTSTNALTLGTAVTNIPFYKTSVTPKDLQSVSGALTEIGHYAVQATLSNLQTVVYVVGKIAGDSQNNALYRFELLADGSWSPPQLLARDIATLAAKYVYAEDCKISETVATNNQEKFFTAKTPFVTKSSVVLPPLSVVMNLTPSAKTADSGTVVTGANDIKPIVLTATMRGADTCSL